MMIPLHVVFVEAWIRKEDKYLLAKRSTDDDQAPGTWALPGGKVEFEKVDRILEKTLTREIREEVGVEVSNPRYFFSRAFIRSSGDHVVGLSFLVDHLSGKAKPLEDHDEVRWATIEEVEDLLDDYFKETLDALKSI